MIILKHTTCRFFISFLAFLIFYSYQSNAEFFKDISDDLKDQMLTATPKINLVKKLFGVLRVHIKMKNYLLVKFTKN